MIAGVPTVREYPYPHFVEDDVLQKSLLTDLRRNWPGRGAFIAEIPGNYVCNLARFCKEGFWREFTIRIVPQLVIRSLSSFAEQIEARYPGESTFYLTNYSLMQSAGDYGGHDVHNHHYHDPMWVMTLLLYIDADAEGHSGTTIMELKDSGADAMMDEAMVAAQTLNWHDSTKEYESVAYKQARIFGFHDNVIAYHCVKPSQPPATFGRRILRFHVCVGLTHCERLYGVDYATYYKMRMDPTKDPRVLEWMKKDIALLRSEKPKMSDDERVAWINKARLYLPPTEPDEENGSPDA